ncbi:hypothetical protein TWF281_004486 [Arthrobotrys megalospora]
MKTTLSLVVFTALAAAAPQSIVDSLMKRESEPRPTECSFSSGCPDGEVCAGQYRLQRGTDGVCIPERLKCGIDDDPDATCPKDKEYKCIPHVEQMKCPMDGTYCGYCVEKWKVSSSGGLKKDFTEVRCDGSFLCLNRPATGLELPCIDPLDPYFLEEDICPEWLLENRCDDDGKCSKPGHQCVPSRCESGKDSERCNRKICLPEAIFKRWDSMVPSERPLPVPPSSKTCTVKPVTKTVTEKETITETVTVPGSTKTVTAPPGKPKLVTTTAIVTEKETVTETVTKDSTRTVTAPPGKPKLVTTTAIITVRKTVTVTYNKPKYPKQNGRDY